MPKVIISVDLGGTNIRAARLDENLNIVERVHTTTESQLGCASTLQRIKDQIRQVLPTDGTPVEGIGISAPGPVNPAAGILLAPPNLGDCYNVPMEREMMDEFGIPTHLGNDANVAALAETILGAARGYRHVIFITVSTGIGGGVLNDGRLLLGKMGLGGEIGHIPLVVDGEVTTLEKESAGPALARKARARIQAGAESMLRDMAEGDLDRIDGKMVGDAVEGGDKLANEIVARGGFILGLGITTLLHIFNPEIIVIGGGVSQIGEPLFAPMREAMQKYTIDRAYWDELKIAPAELGDNVSLVGAGSLVVTHGGTRDVQAIAAEIQT
jgi:glucokinase